jgi:hypothetical protein
MPRHVIHAVSRNGVFGDVMPSRDVAIRGAGPQISFDIIALGVPADGAGLLRHAISAPDGRDELPGAAAVAQVDSDRRAARFPARRAPVLY